MLSILLENILIINLKKNVYIVDILDILNKLNAIFDIHMRVYLTRLFKNITKVLKLIFEHLWFGTKFFIA